MNIELNIFDKKFYLLFLNNNYFKNKIEEYTISILLIISQLIMSENI